MKDSFVLTKQALEGTQAAVLTVDVDYRSGDYRGGDYWALIISNTGKVAAPTLDVTVKVSRVNVSDGKILNTKEDHFSQTEVMPPPSPAIVRGFETVDLFERSREIIEAEETFKIEGSIRYNNGFDRTVNQNFCLESFPNPNKGNVPIAGWISCDQAPARLQKYRTGRNPPAR
jgi:hypothetical protein